MNPQFISSPKIVFPIKLDSHQIKATFDFGDELCFDLIVFYDDIINNQDSCQEFQMRKINDKVKTLQTIINVMKYYSNFNDF